MAGRWRGMLGRLDVQDPLDRSYSKFLSYFSNPLSKLPLTYHCEFIDKDSTSGAKRLLPPRCSYVIYDAQTLLHSPLHDIAPSVDFLILGKLSLQRSRDFPKDRLYSLDHNVLSVGMVQAYLKIHYRLENATLAWDFEGSSRK